MKNRLYFFIAFTSTFGFSQSPDSLKINYYIGHDCSYTIGTKELRGGCTRLETIEYTKKKSYRASLMLSKESFREWKGEFGPNLIEDSLTTHRIRNGKKIPSTAFDGLMKRICSVTKQTIFTYEKKDIPESFFLRRNLDPEELELDEIDAILRENLNSVASSSVVSYVEISFQVEGKHYKLWKNPNNLYWFFLPEGIESEYPLHIVCFQLDAFLSDHLPKHFTGSKVLN